MYKFTIEPGIDSTSKIITVYQKKNLFYISYWTSVERVLTYNKYADFHLDHFQSKYNFVQQKNYVPAAILQPAM